VRTGVTSQELEISSNRTSPIVIQVTNNWTNKVIFSSEKLTIADPVHGVPMEYITYIGSVPTPWLSTDSATGQFISPSNDSAMFVNHEDFLGLRWES
jgi:hypothetical protein